MSMKPENTDSIRYPAPAAVDAPGGAIEPWFTVLLLALVPLVGAMFVPAPWQVMLHVLGGMLCSLGLIMLVRHEMSVRRQRNVTDR
jgi:hypothetical protein